MLDFRSPSLSATTKSVEILDQKGKEKKAYKKIDNPFWKKPTDKNRDHYR